MLHAMIAVPHELEEGWLDRMAGIDGVRAAAELSGSTYRAVAFSSPSSAEALSATQTEICALTDCAPFLLSTLARVISHIRPAEDDLILFAFLGLQAGSRREFAAHVRELPAPAEGIGEAVMHALGAPGVGAVVELVGSDPDALTARLLEITDVELVTSTDVHFTTPGRTHGFGGSTGR